MEVFSNTGKMLPFNDCVRLDFMIQNIYAHVTSAIYPFPKLPPMNEKELATLNTIQALVDAYKEYHALTMYNHCQILDISTDEDVGHAIRVIAARLFEKDLISHSIIPFFVLIGEMASAFKGISDYTIHVLYYCFSEICKEVIYPWIKERQGWGELQLKRDHDYLSDRILANLMVIFNIVKTCKTSIVKKWM